MARMLDVTIDLYPSAKLIRLSDCVTRYDLREGISQLFELTLEVALSDAALDPRGIVGEGANVTFGGEPFHSQVSGIVRRMRQLSSEPTGLSRYEILVVPRLWLATRRRDHRIFQHKSVIAIAEEVIEGYGGRIVAPRSACGVHAPRDYCVQYAETDFDFIARVLADEGVAFIFDHNQRLSSAPIDGQAISTLLLLDDTTALSLVLQGAIPFVPPGGQLKPTVPHVSAALLSAGMETSAVTLRDYDFEKPAFLLEAEERAKEPLFNAEPGLEAYTYEVGQFTTPDGKARASQLLEEARGTRSTFELEASFALAPGTRLKLTGHPNSDVNTEMLVVRSRSTARLDEANGPVAFNTLECVPASERYRPPRLSKPRIHGTQTAFVVGKKLSVDEIDVDRFGRVKVHFTWDRRPSSFEGKPTRFIRVSHGWAGQGYGLVLLPRVGDEVIVAYLDGDPDEPIIVGRVHNGFHTTPLNLANPDEHTVSMWKSRSSPADKAEEGFNMIRMQDKAGAEMLELRAQRDFRSESRRDSTTMVGNNASTSTTGNASHKVGGAYSLTAGSTSISTGECSISAASITESARTDVTITAGDKRTDESSNHFLKSGSFYATLSDVFQINAAHLHAFCGTSIKLVCGGAIELVCGGSSITLTPGAIDIKSGGTVTINGAVVDVKGAPIKLNC